MKSKVVGRVACTECDSYEDVKFDGKKYYVSCLSCGVIVNYQSKDARNRILAKMLPVQNLEEGIEEENKTVLAVDDDCTEKQELVIDPKQSVMANFIDSYAQWYTSSQAVESKQQ